ncbi:MAG: sensor histidine kinase [Saprospirales bacterium]|nr:MAG: sensor histidine kinase [Saprospirales bacterium]
MKKNIFQNHLSWVGLVTGILILVACGGVVLYHNIDLKPTFLEEWKVNQSNWTDAARVFLDGSDADQAISAIRKTTDSPYSPQFILFEGDDPVYAHSPIWLPKSDKWSDSDAIYISQRENIVTGEFYFTAPDTELNRQAFVLLPLYSRNAAEQEKIFRLNYKGFVPFELEFELVDGSLMPAVDGPVRSSSIRLWSAISVVLGFLSALIFAVLYVFQRFKKLLLNPVKFLPVLVPVILLRFAWQTDTLAEVNEGLRIFRSGLLECGGNWSPGLLIMDFLLYFLVAIVFLNVPVFSKKGRQFAPGIRALLTVGGYWIIICGWIVFTLVVGMVVNQSTINMDLDNVFTLDRYSFAALSGILLFLVSQFLISIKLGEIIHNLGIPLNNRIMSIGAAALLSLPLLLMMQTNLHPFPFFLAVFLFVFLLDLFSEKVNVGYPWIFLWLLVLSSCTAALMYKYSLDNDHEKRIILADKFKAALAENNAGSETFYQISRELRKGGETDLDFAIFVDSTRIWSNNPVYPDVLAGAFANMEFGQLSRINRRTELLLDLNVDQNAHLIVGRYSADISRPISVFSYLFFSLILFAALLGLLNKKLAVLPNRWTIEISDRPSLRRKVQFLVVSLTVGSFVLVSFMTIYFFQFNNQRQIETSLLENAQNVKRFLIVDHSNPDWSEMVQQVASEYKLELGLYDRTGQFIAGSQKDAVPVGGFPGILTPLMLEKVGRSHYFFNGLHPRFSELKMLLKQTFIDGEEHYFLLGSDPVFRQQAGSVNDFLSPLINVFLFLFLLSGALAFVLSDGITKPLLRIRDSLNKVKLGRQNEPIDWQKNDELGELIDDYNRIIKEIDESAKILAMTEREVAWREMAKQVAHEIKNPLTPMKLSIQHLQYASGRDPERLTELIGRTSSTLIEQIDNLSRIASEFSTFAKMPEAMNEKVNLNDLVSSGHELFRNRDDMDIALVVPIDEIYVFADRNYLMRVLTNLVKNSIQAIPMERRGKIKIKLYQREDQAIIEVADNGCGIPEEVREKVFKPNFTSKNSGTGLGLAICNNIVESFHGRIYFETEVDEGTSFIVELPRMRSSKDQKPQKRVELD